MKWLQYISIAFIAILLCVTIPMALIVIAPVVALIVMESFPDILPEILIFIGDRKNRKRKIK